MHEVVHGAGEVDEVIIALGMAGERDEDVVSAGAGDDGGVVMPILPGAPFADDLNIATGEAFNELDVVRRDVGRGENFAHGLGGGGRDELVLFEPEIEAKQLADGDGVGFVADGVADALIVRAVMFADPNAAAVIGMS